MTTRLNHDFLPGTAALSKLYKDYCPIKIKLLLILFKEFKKC